MPETKKTTSVKPKQVAAVKKKSVKSSTPAKESKWSTKLIRQGLVPTLSNYFFGPAGAIVSGLTPFNARQAMAAFMTGDSNFSLKDAPEGVQRALYESIAKANSNNKEKTKGEFRGTQYKDYSPEMEDVLQNLKGSMPSVLKGSLLSDDFNAATTFGRVSYKDNPETNSYDVYDNYDFTTTNDVSSPYARIRNMVGDLAKGTPLDPTNKGKSNYIGSFKKEDWDKKSKGLLDVPFSKIQKTSSSGSKKVVNKKQDGGWLNKFQNGGEEEKTYGTYNLPEVVVTPEPEEKGFWKQSIRSYLDENKDAGFLGALGSVVTYPLGLPQQAMMYGLTGKVQKPSESLGINNRLGALATDIIADPTNLLGVGIADDALKLSSKAGKFLKEETALKNAYKANPWAEKLKNPNSSYRVAGLDAAEDFKNTGVLRSRNTEPGQLVEGTNFVLPPRPTSFPSFQKGYADLNYLPDEGGVIFKTDLPTFKRGELNPVTGFPIKGRHYAHRVIDPKTGATVTNVPGADVKMYNSDPHWLKGYPEVPVELPGSPNGFFEETKALGKGIVSELKQIPKNLKYKINNYSELKKLPAQYKNAVKEMTTPEGLTRLKNLGIDDTDDFLKYLNDIKKAGSNELGNSFYPVGQGAININPEELKLYRSTKAPFAVPETVIDHELGHAIQYYLKKKGKVYPSLKNPYNAPTDIDMEAVDKLLPHTTNKVSTFFKEQALQKSPEELANMFKGNKHDLRSAEYFFNSESGREPLAHLRELKRNLKNEGVINDIQETVTPEHLKAFIDKTGNKDRVMSFMQNTPEAHKTLSTLLNKIPAVVPIGLGAAALQQEKLGGWLDNEFKRGGQKGLKKYTSKNIQSSVNDIMLRNETLFGPAGKRRFKPGLKYKDGGWLDNLLD